MLLIDLYIKKYKIHLYNINKTFFFVKTLHFETFLLQISMETESNYMIVCFFILRNKGSKTFSNLGLCHLELRNKSWKSECVGSFNMDWRILVFYPEPEARDKIY
jgi:hypothetical protein